MILDILKVFGLSAFAFFFAFFITPFITRYLYKYKLWRKEVRTKSPDGSGTPIFAELHKEKEVGTPRMGGIIIWLSVLFIALLFWLLDYLTAYPLFEKLNFLSRGQTWLPLFTLVAAALVGFADDIFQVFGKGKYIAGGMTFTRRLVLIILIALVGAWWFYFKLETNGFFLPFYGEISLGYLFPLFFILTMLATFSGGVIDGLDGLAGGVLASIFTAYAGIAFFQQQIDLAALSGVITGAILAFLWFNIPPARFYMGETGIMGLTTSLTVIAFLTDSVAVLPLIAFPLVLESASVIIQLASKRFRGKKVFLVAPIHHHFEAKGWPSHKVTMRFWVISVIFAVIGMVIALVGRI